MKRLFGLSLLTFLALGSGLAEAGAIAITNASFEAPATVTVVNNTATGWTVTVNANGIDSSAEGGVYNPYSYQGNNAFYSGANSTSNPSNGGSGLTGIDGENLGYVYQAGIGSGFSQTLSATLSANTSYTLTVSVGHRNGTTLSGASLGSKIELLAGTTVIASSSVNNPTLGFSDQTVTLADSSAFSSHYGEALTIKLSTTLAMTTFKQATDWDNVRLTSTDLSAVPEPSSLVLAGIGALGLFAVRSKRRKVGA